MQRQGFFSTVDIAGPTPPLARLPQGIQQNHIRLPNPSKGETKREKLLTSLVRYRLKLEAEALKLYQEKSAEEITKAVRERASITGQLFQCSREEIEWALANAHRSEHDILNNGVDVDVMGLTVEGVPLDATSRAIDTKNEGIITQQNRASRRLWLGLKYWNGEPVLHKARMVSKPSKRMWLDTKGIARVIRGAQAGEVKGMTKIGEIMAVSTDKGIMDARECVERQIGGQPLARFY